MFCLADSNFYIWDFWLYKGSKSERSTKPMDIVLDFVSSATKIQHKPLYVVAHIMKVSNWQKHFIKRKLDVFLVANLNLFSKFLYNDLKKDSFNFTNNRNFSAMTFYDKTKVNLITNLFLTNKMAQNST